MIHAVAVGAARGCTVFFSPRLPPTSRVVISQGGAAQGGEEAKRSHTRAGPKPSLPPLCAPPLLLPRVIIAVVASTWNERVGLPSRTRPTFPLPPNEPRRRGLYSALRRRASFDTTSRIRFPGPVYPRACVASHRTRRRLRRLETLRPLVVAKCSPTPTEPPTLVRARQDTAKRWWVVRDFPANVFDVPSQ